MRITVRHLWKTYGKTLHALRDVSLDIGTGMFGLLGPNGAGKTTLMKILATLETPSAGQVLVNGTDINTQRAAVRQTLGYLPQFFGVYPQLSGTEFLAYIAALNDIPRKRRRAAVQEALERVGLAEVGDRKVRTYSGGMVRRLGIAQAVIGDPKLLIVDEPTVGLDPEERIRFRNLLANISRNKAIILSTHIVGDISSTCEDLALLSHGQVVFHGDPARLLDQTRGHVWSTACTEDEFSAVAARMQIISCIVQERRRIVRAVGDPVPGLAMWPETPNLEDAYMYMTQEAL
ncbi:MAG: ABC transporter ATP-binding protein [Candidatus Latescibacteria bacterium]|nr:ABC transporter ATP-binding protein [Candidatus Latescibacterota bacterium]